MLRHCDLFSGIGGFSLAAGQVGEIHTTQFVELNPDAQLLLRSRFPGIPIHPDIRDYYPAPGQFDLFTLGFPCTGTSSAGKRNGLSHPESRLWREGLRCICLARPGFVVVEQPEGFINRGLRAVLGGLRMAGYQTEVELVSAAGEGAPHQRNRIFIVAYANHLRQRFRETPPGWQQQIGAAPQAIPGGRGQAEPRRRWLDDGLPPWLGGRHLDGWWAVHPATLYPGIRHHTDSRRACCDLYGQSVTPQQAAISLQRVLYLSRLCQPDDPA